MEVALYLPKVLFLCIAYGLFFLFSYIIQSSTGVCA